MKKNESCVSTRYGGSRDGGDVCFLGRLVSSGTWRIMLIVTIMCGLSACDFGVVAGESKTLKFSEPNSYAADSTFSNMGFDQRIAVGSKVDLSVSGCHIVEITSDDPATLKVEESPDSLIIFPGVARLSALKAGTTRLRVKGSCSMGFPNNEKSDSLLLTTVEPDKISIWVDHNGVHPAHLADGFALRPDATIKLRGQTYHKDEPLLGFNVIPWAFDSDLVDAKLPDTESVPANGKVNQVKLTGRGVSGLVSLTTELADEVAFATLSADEPPTLKVYSLTRLRAPEVYPAFPLEVEELTPMDVYCNLVGRDADGRYVIPSQGDKAAFSWTVTEGAFDQLKITSINTQFTIKGCSGSGTIRFSYMGAELDIPMELGDDHVHDDCVQEDVP
jgi:hypothetical protein